MSRINDSLRRTAARCTWGIAVSLLFSLAALTANAQLPYDKLIVFGDSLSDNGNFFALSGNTFPPFPYYQGRFSNGPVWTEDLAARFGIPLEDHAFGGAHTDTLNSNSGIVPTAPGMQTTIGNYVAANPVLDPKALYIVWGGANDYLTGQTNPFIPVGNLTNEIGSLAAHGAKQFLIPNLPDLGSVPGTLVLPPASQDGLNQLTAGHNQILAGSLASLSATFPTDRFTLMDVHSLVAGFRADPGGNGFTNVSQGAITVFPNSADGYLFWDDFHPTAVGHLALSNQAFVTLVPEPGAAGLLAGLCVTGAGFAARRLRRKKRSA